MDLDEPKLPPRPPQLLKQLQALLEQLIADVTANSISNDSDVGDATSVDSNDDAWNLQKRQQQQRQEHRLVVVASLLRKDQLPARQRTKIEELVDDYNTNFSRDVHEMITDQHHDPAEYQGLDSNRDTPEEVETVLRLCPETIKQTRSMVFSYDPNPADPGWVEAGDDDNYYPIQCLTWVQDNEGYGFFNLKAIPFVHLFARLAIEFNSFDEDKRGGLMFADPEYYCDNIIHLLADKGLTVWFGNEDDHRYMDAIRTTEYKRLRKMGLMVKNDILDNELLENLCYNYSFFPEESATFIIEWCPESLLSQSSTIEDSRRSGPFYEVADAIQCCNLEPFRFIFDYLIRYYPYKKGICFLFKNVYNRNGDGTGSSSSSIYSKLSSKAKKEREKKWLEYPKTPFHCATTLNNYEPNPVEKQQKEKQQKLERNVLDIVNDVLSKYSGTTPINTKDALITAAMDPSIHLDGLYFLMRRQPDVLVGMLKSSISTNNSIDHDGDTTNDRDTNTNTNTNTTTNTSSTSNSISNSTSTNNNRSSNDDDNNSKSTTHDQNDQNDDDGINNTTTQNGKRKRSHPIIVFDDDDRINNNATQNGNRKSSHPFIFFDDDVMN